jgi:hypothetical protein
VPAVRRLALLALFLGLDARAVPPDVPWFTLEAPHFRVHYHDGPKQHAFAQRLARACEAAHEKLVPLIGWAPERKTEVLLSDDSDSANGSANAYLQPVLTVLAEAPDDQSVLNDYEDYVWQLVAHEYTHILHLDSASGLPALVNRVFGKMITPNAYVPRWLTEGLATYEESNLSSAGRNRSALFDMWLRASVLEGPAFRLDELTHNPTRWPTGNLAYLEGGRFLRYVAERVGEERLTRYVTSYGAKLIPWSLNLTAEEELGASWVSLHRDWQAALETQYRAQADAILAAGQTHPRLLTHWGAETGQPHFTPDGRRVVYLQSGFDRHVELRSVGLNGEGDRREFELVTDVVFDLSPDGLRVAFARPDIYREYQLVDDLYEVELGTGRERRLTEGLRATEPAYSPDGSLLAFVGRAGSGSTYLALFDLRSARVTRLFDASADERVFTPAFTPDGRALVFSQQSGSARHVRALDLATREVRTVAGGPWLNLQPHVTADGTVLVTSDRSGVYNVHALRPAGGRVDALTNLVTGALRPTLSPDGATLAFALYSSRGYDIAVLPIEEAFDGTLPDRAARPAPVFRDDPSVVYPVRPYQPWASMLPLYWVPVSETDPLGLALGATTSGGDLIGRHRWALSGSWGLVSREPSVSAAYGTSVLWPDLVVSAATYLAQATGFPKGLTDRVWSAAGRVSFAHSLLGANASVSLGYEWRLLDPHNAPVLAPDAVAPVLPSRGTAGALSLSWQFSNARGYPSSISAEEGWVFGVSARHSGPETFATFTYASVEARVQAYQALPWAPHHVLAARLAAGGAVGDLGLRPVFALGGISLHDPVMQLVDDSRTGAGYLRGYPPGAFGGNSYALLNLEYRLPLANLDRGFDTLPLYLRRIHARVFTDVGAVGDGANLRALKPSLGAELQLELLLGYFVGTNLRLGYARGLAPEGVNDVYLGLGSTY